MVTAVSNDNVVRRFQTAKSRGLKVFMLDDEGFRIKPVTVGMTDALAQMIFAAEVMMKAKDARQMPSSHDLLAVATPFVVDEDVPRFEQYCREWVEPDDYVQVILMLVEEVTGLDPTQLVNSASGPLPGGEGSLPGPSPTESPTPSPSPSMTDSPSTSSPS